MPVYQPSRHHSSSLPQWVDRSRGELRSTSPLLPQGYGHWSARTPAGLEEGEDEEGVRRGTRRTRRE